MCRNCYQSFDDDLVHKYMTSLEPQISLTSPGNPVPMPDVMKKSSTYLDSSKDESNPKDLEGNKKPQISLVPPSAIIHLADAFKEGARKYGAYNWRTKKVQSLIYCDAIMRHLLAYIDGEDIDPESGKHHLSGVLASAAVLIDATETGNLIDNRPAKGKASEILTRLRD